MKRFLWFIPLWLIFVSSPVFSQDFYISDITKVPLIGTGVITMNGSGGSLPGCSFNTDATNESFPEDLQKAKSIRYTIGNTGKCENIQVIDSAILPAVDPQAMQLNNPAVDLSWMVVTAKPFTVSEVETYHGTATMFESGLFKCAVGDKAILQRMEIMGFFDTPQGIILSSRNTKTGSEAEEPYSRCTDFRMIMDPSLYVTPTAPPPVDTVTGCEPAP